MSATNFTPIQLYRTSTAAAVPTAGNLAAGELAINLTDERLYFKNAAGVVKLLASNSGSLGTVTSVDVSGGTTGLTTSGGPITSSGTITLAGTLGVANGGTGTATAFTAGSVVFAGASGVYSQDNANFFWDNANDRLGIGINTPAIKLQVSDVDQATARIGVRNANGQNYHLVAGTPGASNTGFAIFDATASATRMYISSAGDVGIGTNNPLSTLDVTGSAGITTTSGGNTARIIAAASGTFFGSTTNTAVIFQANSAEAMRITSAGDVGIGATTTNGKLTIKNPSASGDQVIFNVQAATSTTSIGRVSYNQTDDSMRLFNESNFAGSTLLFGVNNTERMRIDYSGNVGIGTSNTAPANGFGLVVGSSASTITRIDMRNSTTGLASGDGTSLYLGGNDFTIENREAGFVAFATSLTERMRIDSSGNVGIGTSSPDVFARGYSGRILGISSAGQSAIELNSATGSGAYFDFGVNGTRTASIYSDVSSTDFSVLGARNFSLGTTGAGFLVLNTNNIERARIDTSGNVGIGTTSPANNLQVVGAVANNPTTLNVTHGASGNFFDYAAIGVTAVGGINGSITSWGTGSARAGTFWVGTSTNQPTVFSTNDTERMRIDTSGNLLFNCTAGGAAVDGLRFTSSNVAQFSRTSADTLSCNRNGTDGDVAVWYKAGTAVGSISVTGAATAYNTSSDYRLKEIDGPITNSGAYIDALKPVQGSWKADGSRFIGLLAHEVQEVSETPIATGEKDGEKMQAMDYSAPELIANLIAEIQSLRARVAQLEGN